MDKQKILNNLQENCNQLYNEYGASDEVIALQVAINKFRNFLDIPDEAEMTDSNKGFVQ